jgi:uncharacterized protein YcbX
MATVARVNVTPVKALALDHPERVELTERGVAENRRFYLVDEGGRLFGGSRYGPLVRVRPEWDGTRLALTFPDGTRVEEEVEVGVPVETDFWGDRVVRGRRVAGPWAAALSELAGRSLSLVRVDDDSLAVDIAAATLVSDGSLAALGGLDGRRFRMLLELEGCEPWQEDAWRGQLVRAGSALLRVGGPVPRCVVTTQDPTTGVRDHDTLRAIRAVRGESHDGRPYVGVYADVAAPGVVAVGDAVDPV